MKIHQIYYERMQRNHLDHGFSAYDNCSNEEPGLAEWYIMNKEYEANKHEDYWGFFSWKFKQKMNLTSAQVYQFIKDNPNKDCYIFNPCIANEAMYANVWEQGMMFFPDLVPCGDQFFRSVSRLISVANVLTDRRTNLFCSFIIANDKFWSEYNKLIQQVFVLADQNEVFKTKVFNVAGSEISSLAQKSRHKVMPLFPFLQERILPTYLHFSTLEVAAYKHTPTTLPKKYSGFIKDIDELSDLKVALNDETTSKTLTDWINLRNRIALRNSAILNLE